MFVSAIVAAAGAGTRMGSDVQKAFVEIAGVPMAFYSLHALQSCDQVSEIVLVTSQEGREQLQSMQAARRFPKLSGTVLGGAFRQDSVYNGLLACDRQAQVVVVHDAARPLVDKEWIVKALEALLASDCAGVAFASPVTDTLKRANADATVLETASRNGLFAVQTPQAFRTKWLIEAHEHARLHGIVATDDAGLVEAIAGKIKLLPGSRWNIKVTFQEDVILLEQLLRNRAREWFDLG